MLSRFAGFAFLRFCIFRFMQLNTYLRDTFLFNDATNLAVLKKIRQLSEPAEAIRLFSHLLNSQHKWWARIMQDPKAPAMSWWDPVYGLDQLEAEWSKSLRPWLNYLDQQTEDQLSTEVSFSGLDNVLWAASPKDIMLQLNYHSIHHRAQIQTILRQQGIEPDFVDYIGTRYRKM